MDYSFLSVGKRGFKSNFDLASIILLIFKRLRTGVQWRELPIESYFEEIFMYSLQTRGIEYHHTYFKDEHRELNIQITEWLNNSKTLKIFYEAIEKLLLSDIVLNEKVVYQLENMYNILEFELKNQSCLNFFVNKIKVPEN